MRHIAWSALAALALTMGGWADAAEGNIYLVRHAEAPGSPSPRTLNKDGKKQAKRLSRLLKVWAPNLEHVYYTDTVRNRQTADPAIKRMKVAATCYESGHPDNGVAGCDSPIAVDAMIAAIRKCDAGPILVVGHSNTIGDLLLPKLGVPESEIVPDRFEEYGHIFVVPCDEGGKLKVLEYCLDVLKSDTPSARSSCVARP